MTQIRLTLSGIIKTVKHFNVGDKPAVEFSVCVKNRAAKGEDPDRPSFTWARGVVFDCPAWMVLEKGMEVTALNGKVTLRSYKDKEGVEKVSLDAIYSSFDVQVHGAKEVGPVIAQRGPMRPAAPAAAADVDDGSPPF
jgi:hypothetical protein